MVAIAPLIDTLFKHFKKLFSIFSSQCYSWLSLQNMHVQKTQEGDVCVCVCVYVCVEKSLGDSLLVLKITLSYDFSKTKKQKEWQFWGLSVPTPTFHFRLEKAFFQFYTAECPFIYLNIYRMPTIKEWLAKHKEIIQSYFYPFKSLSKKKLMFPKGRSALKSLGVSSCPEAK